MKKILDAHEETRASVTLQEQYIKKKKDSARFNTWLVEKHFPYVLPLLFFSFNSLLEFSGGFFVLIQFSIDVDISTQTY